MSQATGIFAKISQALTAKRAATAQSYTQMVVDIAAGKEIDPGKVAQTIDAEGKTLEQLQKDVEHVTRRRAMRDKNATLKKAADGRESHQRKLDTLEAEFKAYKEAHNKKLWPIEQAERESTDAITTIDGNRSELLLSCKNPALHAEKEELQQQINAASLHLQGCVSRFERHLSRLQDIPKSKSLGSGHPKDMAKAAEAERQIRANVDSARSDREAADRELQRLIGLMDELTERMRQSDF